MVTVTSKHPIILGFPWLHLHDPQISWHEKEITQWSEQCLHRYFHLPCLIIASTSVESANAPSPCPSRNCITTSMKCSVMPWASDLPPHRPYCTIDLLPSSMPPHNCIYSLSLNEQGAMEDYVHEALQQGYLIEPPTTPTSAGFFLMEKNRRRPMSLY